MTLEEMRDLLATVAGYDGRRVDLRTIEDWHAALGTIPHELAMRAVRAWYVENRGYIQPRDVIEKVAEQTGHDRPDSITARRLEGRPMIGGAQELAEPMQIQDEELE